MIKQAKSVKKNTNTVVFIFEDTKKSDLVTQLDQAQVDIILDYKKNEKIKDNTVTKVQLEATAKSNSLIIAQLGKQDDYSIKQFRGLVAKANRMVIKETSVQWVSLAVIENWEWHAAQVIQMVQYEAPHSKSDKKPESYPAHTFVGSQKKLVNDGFYIGEAVNKARTFSNLPANILTTTEYVNQIKDLFKGDKRYKVTVLSDSDLKKKKMMALLGVGQGSKYPSYLVDITYDGGGKDHVALVGKGVVFDTGGISIKPSNRMREMKGDMGGSAAVVAAAWAVGKIDLKRKVSFIVPIVENMVSMEAQRPGDVVVASNGTSIEITNTDAEGRLILADALVYATKKKVDSIVDIATLTGASIIALGSYAVATLGNNQALVDDLIAAGKRVNEPLWQLPLFDEYKDLLKSDVADILNANEGREAGTITAAKFLEQFVGDTPWAHLDIASTMSVNSNKDEHVKGMTGAGTKALISYLLKE